MVGCKDCIHHEVCDYRDPERYAAIQDLKNACRNCIPTADVVPKSEVEELKAIIADHKASEERWEELYSNAKAEVAREIFEEINTIKKEYASGDIDGNELYVRLYMLEKKYTEEKE